LLICLQIAPSSLEGAFLVRLDLRLRDMLSTPGLAADKPPVRTEEVVALPCPFSVSAEQVGKTVSTEFCAAGPLSALHRKPIFAV
jgi:hypothetical protein